MEYKVCINSWHYRLLAEVSRKEEIERMDFCQYWRAIVFAVLILLFSALVVILMGICMLAAPILLTLSYFGLYTISAAGIVSITLLGIFLWLTTVAVGIVLAFKSLTKSQKDSLVAMKYRSWKEKWCPRLTFLQ